MIVDLDEITITMEELEKIDMTNPYRVAAGFIQVISSYDKKNEVEFYKKIDYLFGEIRDISNLEKQQIKDRLYQNNKYDYIGKSYFVGAVPNNDYTPTKPYKIEIIENEYSNIEDGYKRLYLKSGGADSTRSIVLRQAKNNNYYIWSDSYMGLLTDIRPKESDNYWA